MILDHRLSIWYVIGMKKAVRITKVAVDNQISRMEAELVVLAALDIHSVSKRGLTAEKLRIIVEHRAVKIENYSAFDDLLVSTG